MHIWKINMVDGSEFLVHSYERDAAKFVQEVLPRNGEETISVFKCAKTSIVEDYMYDSVVIVGSKVSSVEYYVENENNK